MATPVPVHSSTRLIAAVSVAAALLLWRTWGRKLIAMGYLEGLDDGLAGDAEFGAPERRARRRKKCNCKLLKVKVKALPPGRQRSRLIQIIRDCDCNSKRRRLPGGARPGGPRQPPPWLRRMTAATRGQVDTEVEAAEVPTDDTEDDTE